MAKRPDPAQLLHPDKLDGMKLVGTGFAGRVYRRGRYAVKVPHPNDRCRQRVREELVWLRALQGATDIPVPRLYAANDDRFVRDFLGHDCLLDLLREHRGAVPRGMMAALWRTYEGTERIRHEQNVVLDFTPANLFYDARRDRMMLADLGPRIAPYPFADLDRRGLRSALREYLPWRAALEAHTTVSPMHLPPSGRFHVDVGVRRNRDAKLVWANQRALQRLGIDLDARKLHRVAAIHTDDSARHQLPATYYEDSPRHLPNPALGDGRAVYVGEVAGGAYERYELMAKGCGPTPLAWVGNRFHEDGYVSFPRTLWETTVAATLAALQFDTPEVLAILDSGKRTLDNTQKEWPAAVALRASPTHFRLAHLKRWDDNRNQLTALATFVGRQIIDPSFDATTERWARKMCLNFSHTLGENTGRTDALQIHCFNPTPGNVRLDGHFLDYSTVRFTRHYLPHFRHPEPKWIVGEQRRYWRKFIRLLVGIFVRGRLLPKDRRFLDRCVAVYDDAYNRGYLRGVFTWLGTDVPKLRSNQARALVEATEMMRRLRCNDVVEYPYWRQRVPAPRFDLAGQSARLVAAYRAGEDEPWRELNSEFSTTLPTGAATMAGGWWQRLEPHLRGRRLRPRTWNELFAPSLEAEALAALCYARSTPADFAEWQHVVENITEL